MVDSTYTTLKYYNENADTFVAGTVSVKFGEIQDKFLKYLKSGDYILDFGCGSGRDTKYFLEKEMKVEAVDGSEKLCKIAQKYTGIAVKQMLFQELNVCEKYDGIWACSSILHLRKEELKAVLKKMVKAVKTGGIIYTSFKYGDFEGMRNGRYFTDFRAETFQNFIENIEHLEVMEYWITGDARQGRGEEKWLNLILHKE